MARVCISVETANVYLPECLCLFDASPTQVSCVHIFAWGPRESIDNLDHFGRWKKPLADPPPPRDWKKFHRSECRGGNEVFNVSYWGLFGGSKILKVSKMGNFGHFGGPEKISGVLHRSRENIFQLVSGPPLGGCQWNFHQPNLDCNCSFKADKNDIIKNHSFQKKKQRVKFFGNFYFLED